MHDEAEADGFAGEVLQAGFGFPGDRVIDAIADDGGAIGEGEVFDGGAGGVLEFDGD